MGECRALAEVFHRSCRQHTFQSFRIVSPLQCERRLSNPLNEVTLARIELGRHTIGSRPHCLETVKYDKYFKYDTLVVESWPANAGRFSGGFQILHFREGKLPIDSQRPYIHWIHLRLYSFKAGHEAQLFFTVMDI